MKVVFCPGSLRAPLAAAEKHVSGKSKQNNGKKNITSDYTSPYKRSITSASKKRIKWSEPECLQASTPDTLLSKNMRESLRRVDQERSCKASEVVAPKMNLLKRPETIHCCGIMPFSERNRESGNETHTKDERQRISAEHHYAGRTDTTWKYLLLW